MQDVFEFLRNHLTLGAVGASIFTFALESSYRAALRAAGRYAAVRRILAKKSCGLGATDADDAILLGDQGTALFHRLVTSMTTLSCVYSLQGIGVSTMIRSVAASHPAVMYISFADVINTQEMTLRVAQAFGIAVREQGSILGDVAQRVILALRLNSSHEENEDAADPERAHWLRTISAVNAILADCGKSLRGVINRSNTEAFRPLVFIDDISTLSEEQLAMLQDWGASCHVAHIALVTNRITSLLGRWSTSKMHVYVVRPASLAVAARFLAHRTPLDLGQSTALTRRIVGTRAQDLVAAVQLCRQFASSGGQIRILQHSTMSIGDKETDPLTDFLFKSLVRDVFASSRGLHLYSCQRLEAEEAKVDRMRAGVFAVSMRLIDASGCSSHADITLESLSTVINFETVLAVCPLAVFIELGKLERGSVPFSMAFDTVEFKSIAAMHAMAWVVGFKGDERRGAAQGLVARLW
jgi:hypothetical protein